MTPPTASRGRDFVIFFEQKEGTTAIVRLLNGFSEVDVIRSRGDLGALQPPRVRRDGSRGDADMHRAYLLSAPLEAINEVYHYTAKGSLSRYDPDASLGFKVRHDALPDPAGVIDVLRRQNVLVFLAVRQNVFRWCRPGTTVTAPGRQGICSSGLRAVRSNGTRSRRSKSTRTRSRRSFSAARVSMPRSARSPTSWARPDCRSCRFATRTS